MTSTKSIRRNFGKVEKNLPKINLSEVQTESWQLFLTEGIKEEIAQVSPIDDFTGKNWQLILGEHFLGLPTISPRLAQKKGITYASPLKIREPLNKKTGKEVTQNVFLGDIPQMTTRGTFIVSRLNASLTNPITGAYLRIDPSSGRVFIKLRSATSR
jgi:DNA-directed RNA polymerase subunit beta